MLYININFRKIKWIRPLKITNSFSNIKKDFAEKFLQNVNSYIT